MKNKKDKIVKTKEEWKKQLSPEAFYITREKETEQAFTGQYNRNKEQGVYRCICCGQELFSSDTKFDSGTGWPSFWEPVSKDCIEKKLDRSGFDLRTEVLCSRCDAHLGHVFDDGTESTRQRYCINSASLDFEEKK